jgi:mRNA interferase RelE/StbE
VTYRVEVEPRARKALTGLPQRDRVRIVAAIDLLAEDPRPRGSRPVRTASKGTYRVRVGDYRIVYEVLDDERVVIIARVRRKGKGTYRGLP